MANVKHYHHHYHLTYITSFRHHLTAILMVIAVLLIILIILSKTFAPTISLDARQLSIIGLASATFNTLLRLTIAYTLSLLVAIPLSLIITSSPKIERYLLPFFDILQSIPVLAFFPVVVLAFIHFQAYEAAAIFIIFLDILWNLVFTMIGGLKSIPQDIQSSATVFGATGLKKLWFVTLPAIVPYIITGSLLGFGQGWNIVIVAEVLHTYIPQSTAPDLIGLGSLLVKSVSSGNTATFLAALITMVILIGTMNFFIWQKLLRITERFKFD